MNTILVVCGAGASSTFLASRMRALATERGLTDVTSRPASSLDLDSRLSDASVLLVGPHLASEYSTLQSAAAARGVASALLPSTAFGPAGAAAALDLALSLLSEPPSEIEGSTHG